MPKRQEQTREKDRGARESGRRPGSFWSGTIAFGLVSIPVSLFLASRPSRVALHLVDQDGTPLRRRYVCSRDGEPLEADGIVRGYEVEKDRYVTVSDNELAALAPEKSQEIDLKRFVPLDAIDPIYFERAYFLAPDRGASKAYRLLARTLEETRRAGIATFVMRGKEYLVAIIGEGGLLRAETLRFHDEVRAPEDLGLPPLRPAGTARVKVMEDAMCELQAPTLEREQLVDRRRQRLAALIERKLDAGTDVIAAPEEPAPEEDEAQGAEVVDLMQVLKRSLAQSPDDGEGQDPRPRKTAATRRRRPDLAGASKTVLYERARELGIPGRSAMTREQLLDAIRSAT